MLTLITAPVEEPVSLSEAKLHARIEHSADDTLVTALITAAREQVEHITGRRLINQTWEQVLPAFADSMDLDIGPVSSITSVKYLDSAGAEQTLSNTVYELISESLPPRLVLKTGQSWPATFTADNAVRIRFVAGYGAESTAVPQSIHIWMLLLIGTWYNQREGMAAGATVAEVPRGFWDGLLDPYRIIRL